MVVNGVMALQVAEKLEEAANQCTIPLHGKNDVSMPNPETQHKAKFACGVVDARQCCG